MCFYEFAAAFSKQNFSVWAEDSLSVFLKNAPPVDGLIDQITIMEFLNYAFTQHILHFLKKTQMEIFFLNTENINTSVLQAMINLIEEEISHQSRALTKL